MSIVRYASSDSLGTASLCSQGSTGENGRGWWVRSESIRLCFLCVELESSNANNRVRFCLVSADGLACWL
jgi:hypothetical protein